MSDDDVPMIRVKQFAKIDNDDERNIEISIPAPKDLEVISLSSEEEKDLKPIIKQKSGRKKGSKTPKTPKIKKEKKVKEEKEKKPPLTGLSRRFRTPLKSKYHTITEYFSSTKKDFKAGPITVNPKSLNKLLENEINEDTSEQTENQRLISEIQTKKREIRVVLRRLSIDKKYETKRTRQKDENQSKLPEFIKYEAAGDTYFKMHSNSSFPTEHPPMVRIENGDLLKATSGVFLNQSINQHVKIQTEQIPMETNDFVSMHIDEDSSKDGIFNHEENNKSNEINMLEEKNNKQLKKSQYNLRKTSNISVKAKPIKKTINKTLNAITSVKQKKKIECPHYKIVDGTMFAVDAFRYGDIDGVEHYFLSHFHSDHYIGLKKSFNHTLYVSNITGRLVEEEFKINSKYIKCLDINTPYIIDEVEVTALDANHCPGAVMFLYKLSTGRCILHTGDFRASPEMEEYPEFWNNEIHTIYLDTTYLSSRYDFQTQSDSIFELIDQCRKFIDIAKSSSNQPLIICGAYAIGKEKVWLRIAQEFDFKVWMDENRSKKMRCIDNEEILKVLTPYAIDANIHILPLGNVSYNYVAEYIEQFGETFSKVLAIRPSGWEKNATRPTFRSRISMLGIQYSEHSSYNELERFVRFLRPDNVISTVPFSNKNVAKTPTIPDEWMTKEIKPKSAAGQQTNIKDYFVKKAAQAKRDAAKKQENNKKSQSVPSEHSSDDFML